MYFRDIFLTLVIGNECPFLIHQSRMTGLVHKLSSRTSLIRSVDHQDMPPEPLTHVDVASTPSERFEEYLQSRGMRNTKPRKILVEQVFSSHDHFDVDELLHRLPRKGSEGYVSRATVYRLLSEFVEAGLLRTIELDGRTVYEHDYGYPQHDHLYCNSCEALIEFQSDQLIKLRNELAKSSNFKVSGHRFIISGECESCQKEKRKRVRRKVDLI